MGTIDRWLHAGMLAVAFPFLVSLFVYYGFATSYTGHTFHEAGFRAQYESGVYKYRVLGRELLLETHRFLRSESQLARIARELFAKSPASLAILDPRADPTFYAAYFVQNTAFMILSCILLYVLLGESPAAPTSGGYMAGVSWMAISQYVVCPYDTLSYALILLSFLLIVRPLESNLPILALVLAVSTLARESSALTLSFYFAYHHERLLRFERKELTQLVVLVGVFVATYGLLRAHFGLENALWQRAMLHANLATPSNMAGLLALPVVAYLVCGGSRALRPCLVFLACSSPYIVAMLAIANTWEIRLWVPVWLGLISLAGTSRDILGQGKPPLVPASQGSR